MGWHGPVQDLSLPRLRAVSAGSAASGPGSLRRARACCCEGRMQGVLGSQHGAPPFTAHSQGHDC
jgi:hypothetical protein